MKKKEKGITLIALVVTIVVLLILAGITISTLTGDNGVLTQASRAKENTDESAAREEVMLAYTNAKTKEAIGNEISISKEMKDELIQNDIDTEVSGEERIEVDYKGYQFTIENGSIVKASKNKDKNIQTKQVTDAKPGDITTDKNGNSLDGTSSKPYQINSIEDLIAFSDNVDAGYCEYYIELMTTLNFLSSQSYEDSNRTTLETILTDGNVVTHNYETNIMKDLTTGEGFKAIGANLADMSSSVSFKGTFEGNENWIKNIYINHEEKNNDYMSIGLIAGNRGTIKNLNISGDITGKIKSTYTVKNIADLAEDEEIEWWELDIGAITGDNFGTINNCNSKVNILAECGKNDSIYVGGIAGWIESEGEILDASNSGTIQVSMEPEEGSFPRIYCGGITGYSYGNIIDSSNYGNINGNIFDKGEYYNKYIYCGGIVGRIKGYYSDTEIKISNSYNIGKIEIRDNKNSNSIMGHIRGGGIAGRIVDNVNVSKCYNIGEITCKSNGNCLSEQNYMGGITAKIGSSTIEKCYNIGKIHNMSKGCYVDAGGICARSYGGLVKECYNAGEIIHDGKSYGIKEGYDDDGSCRAGGIVGSNYGRTDGENEIPSTVENCYNIGNITNNGSRFRCGGVVAFSSSGSIVRNSYNIGRIKINENNVSGDTYTGSVVGKNKNGSIVENNYYLIGTYSKGVGTLRAEHQTTEKSEADMKTETFLTMLQNGQDSIWKLVTGANNGYPILSWQE